VRVREACDMTNLALKVSRDQLPTCPGTALPIFNIELQNG
jgi:hypothetical protein